MWPLSGVAVQTNFSFTCERWRDPESPLIYEFSYESKGTKTIFFYRTVASGQSVHLKNWLPIGDELEDFKLNISVHVKDNLGAKTIQEFTLKVNCLAF